MATEANRAWISPSRAALACLVIGCWWAAGCAHRESVRGKVVVITGASSGFGKGVAMKLAERGASVVLAARRTHLLEELARDCEARGGRALAVTTDVSKEADVERLAREAEAHFGRIDVWINDAGVGAFGRFDEIPLADQRRVVEVNFIGVIHGSYYAIRQFRRQPTGGTLINVSSLAGKVPGPYDATYVGTKYAVTGFDRALDQELRQGGVKNIRVCTIIPAATDTPFFQHAANYTGHTLRLPMMDPPGAVVDAIVDAVTDPQREVLVGWKAKYLAASDRVFQRLTENVAGDVTHTATMVDPPPAPPTSGTLHKPMTEGTGVSGGVIERIEREDAARGK